LQRQVAFRMERQNLPSLRGLWSIRAIRCHPSRLSAVPDFAPLLRLFWPHREYDE